MKESSDKKQELNSEFEDLRKKFSIDTRKKEVEKLEKEILDPNFWNNPEKAGKISKELANIKEEIDEFEMLEIEIEEANEDNIDSLIKRTKKKKQSLMFDGPYDAQNAIIYIASGAGGREAEDWASMLMRMYLRWAERNNYKAKVMSEERGEAGGPDGRYGIKEVNIEIKGKYIYGILRKEAGVHRLVRISPFSSKGLRHTSFAKVEVNPIIAEDNSEIQVDPDDLRVDTFRSSGKGGQNVNKRETAVRITHLPTGIVCESQTERHQALNKENAMKALLGKLAVIREKEKKDELKSISGESKNADFGEQTRNYVMQPYQLVKDLKTNTETSNIDDVLDGNLDYFIS